MSVAYGTHSLQINIFTEEVVFRLNITCKTIFILSLQTFKNSLSVLRGSLCKTLISSFAHKMDFAHNFSVDVF